MLRKATYKEYYADDHLFLADPVVVRAHQGRLFFQSTEDESKTSLNRSLYRNVAHAVNVRR